MSPNDTIYEAGDVVIFDTAAGRVIGKYVREVRGQVLLEDPAVMGFVPSEDGTGVKPELAPIAYAQSSYWITWAGVRGHVAATQVFLAVYDAYVNGNHTEVFEEDPPRPSAIEAEKRAAAKAAEEAAKAAEAQTPAAAPPEVIAAPAQEPSSERVDAN